MLTDAGPAELWRRVSVVQAQRQIHRTCGTASRTAKPVIRAIAECGATPNEPRGARNWTRTFAPQPSHEDRTVKAHLRPFPRCRALPVQACSRCPLVLRPSRSSFFCFIKQCFVGLVELWATRQRRPSAAANPQGFAGRYWIRGSSPLWTAALMPAEPHIRSPLQSG